MAGSRTGMWVGAHAMHGWGAHQDTWVSADGMRGRARTDAWAAPAPGLWTAERASAPVGYLPIGAPGTAPGG